MREIARALRYGDVDAAVGRIHPALCDEHEPLVGARQSGAVSSREIEGHGMLGGNALIVPTREGVEMPSVARGNDSGDVGSFVIGGVSDGQEIANRLDSE